MVTIRASSTANYFVPLHNHGAEAAEAAQPSKADDGEEAHAESPHLNAKIIQDAGLHLVDVIRHARSTQKELGSIKVENPRSPAYLVKNSIHTTNKTFIHCVEMLSRSFGSFSTANSELSARSNQCLTAAKSVAVELENVALVFFSALPNGMNNSQAARNGIDLNFYAADAAAKIVSFLDNISCMAVQSTLHINEIRNENPISWLSRRHPDFNAICKANSAIFSAAHDATKSLINNCEYLIGTIHSAFPSSANIHSCYVEIFRKALIPISIALDTSLSFVNLKHTLGNLKHIVAEEFSEMFSAATAQAEIAHQEMNEALQHISIISFTAAYALRQPNSLHISLKTITDHFNYATDCIANFIDANQKLKDIIEGDFMHSSITHPLQSTQGYAYALLSNLILLQRSIKHTVAYSIASTLEMDIGARIPRKNHGTSTVTSPYIEIESLTTTAARLTAGTSFTFRTLHAALGKLSSNLPQESRKYMELAALSLGACQAVYKTIAHYDAIASAALSAAKTENFTLQSFQQKTLKAYQSGQAAITQFRAIHQTLFEELGKNTFNNDLQEKIETTRNAGLAASEAFNALSAHPFFSPTAGAPQTRSSLSQEYLAPRNITEPHTYIEKDRNHSIHTFQRHLLIFSNIRISSRIATATTTSTSALLALERFHGTLAQQSSSVNGLSKVYENSINIAQKLSNHIHGAKSILLEILTVSDEGASDALDISEVYEYHMGKLNETVNQIITHYKNLMSELSQTPGNERMNEVSENIQYSFSSFIESLYSLYYHANGIRISSMEAANDFSAYEVESSKRRQPLTHTEKEDALEILTLPQTATYSGQME